ncbi:choice-of-anchor Q domain-containing protein [Aquipluma nitroreducens]|uniref:choice-of-anchor Q domain-containing protein n=1 Tax=Aquipluma nitroreducens TaxID=2010828 RepID=UPI00296E629E|nr:choice-of-anchor Q domain-containing protein [Aquipluma nitroreducens]
MLPPVSASNWYVDGDAVGTNDGTSWQNAWTGFGSVVWGVSGVKAGDTLFISGGSPSKTYSETLKVGTSGSSSSPIVIKAGQNKDHNGVVTFSGAGIDLNQKSDITVDGNYDNQNHILFTGADIGITNGTNGHMINNIDFDKVGMGININGVLNEIHHCSLSNVNGGTHEWAAIRLSGGAPQFDQNKIHDNYISILSGQGNGYGPDGIQTSSGLSVYNNIITAEKATTSLLTPEHPDFLQAGGSNFLKVYNNEFRNVADAAIQLGVWFDHAYNNVWIYNNIFRIVDQIDGYPEYIRLYAGPGKILSIDNLKILNNTFVDNSDKYLPIRIMGYAANPTGSGNEIKNNIFYNMGTSASFPVVHIEESTGWTEASWTFSNNIYYGTSGLPYIFFRGQSYTIPQWKDSNEPSAITSAPKFMSYVPNELTNDFHLTSGDTVARDKGIDLGAYFTTDKDGVIRAEGIAWDIGAYEASSVSTPSSDKAPPGNLTN